MQRTLAMLATLLFPVSASADVWTFETPSENIQCIVGEGRDSSDLECTIIEYHSPPFVPRPSWCQLDWGHTFRMRDRGHVEMLCVALNRKKDGFDRAEYGVTGRFGGFTCLSSRQGLECRNLDGHGFFLSRGRQTLF
jgi:hypothetical protein